MTESMTENVEKVVEIDTKIFEEALPFIAESLMLNGVIATEIERIYEKDKATFFRITSEYFEKYDQNMLFQNGTLKRELMCNHCMGVLLASQENEEIKKKLLKGIERQYSKLFEYSKKASSKLTPYITYEQNNCTKTTAEKNAYLRIAYLLLVLCNGYHIEKPGNGIRDVIKIMEAYIVDCRKYNDVPSKYTALLSSRAGQIKSVQDEFRDCRTCADILKISDFVDGLKTKMISEQTGQKVNEELLKIGKSVFDVTAGILDYRNLSYTLLLRDTELFKEEQGIIAYFASESGKQNFGEDSSEIVRGLLYVYGIIISSFAKEYQRARQICKENLADELYTEIDAAKGKICRLEKELENAQKQIARLNVTAENLVREGEKKAKDVTVQSHQEIDDLRKQVQKLETEKENWEADKYDYARLKELAYAIEGEVEGENAEYEQVEEILNANKVFLLGGHENWQNQIKKELPGLKIVSGTQHSIKPEIFQSADYVMLFSGHMAHTVYDKVKTYLYKHEIPYDYLAQTNVETVKRQIIMWNRKEKNDG